MFSFADLISTYTRQDALDDGVLIDVTDLAVQCRIRFPVAVTTAVHAACERWADQVATATGTPSNLSERVRDLMRALAHGARGHEGSRLELSPVMAAMYRPGIPVPPLWAHVGPGDAGEPVITVMLVGED